MYWLSFVFVNLTQALVIWEEGTWTEKMLPLRLTCGQAYGTFPQLVIAVEGPAHCGRLSWVV